MRNHTKNFVVNNRHRLRVQDKHVRLSGKTTLFALLVGIIFCLAFIVAFYLIAPDAQSKDISQFDQVTGYSHTVKTSEPESTDGKPTDKKSGLKNTIRIFSDKNSSKQDVQARTERHVTQEQPVQLIEQTGSQHQQWANNTFQNLHRSLDNTFIDSGSLSISGRVLDKNGLPLEGIEVVAVNRDYFRHEKKSASDLKETQNKRITTLSDSEGFYAFKDLPDGTYMLSSNNNKRYLPNSIEVKKGVKYADIVLTEIEIIELQGKVVDQKEQALSGVKISPITKGLPESAYTDTEGNFSLEVSVGEIHNLRLRLQKKGFKKTRHTVKFDTWEAQKTILVSMQEANTNGQVSGQLVGSLNDSMANISVQLYSPSLIQSYKTKTDESGTYQFDQIELASDYRLKVNVDSKSGYKDYAKNNLRVGLDPLIQDIHLETRDPGYRLRGYVKDSEGRPLSNMTMALSSKSSRKSVIPVYTDEKGAYEVVNAPAGELIIRSMSAPFYTVSGITLKGNDRTQELDIVLDSGHYKLLGEIVDQNNNPVAASRIFITNEKFLNGMTIQSSRNTNSDLDGKFLFTDLGARQFTITVNAPGFKSYRQQFSLGQQQPFQIRLEQNES